MHKSIANWFLPRLNCNLCLWVRSSDHLPAINMNISIFSNFICWRIDILLTVVLFFESNERTDEFKSGIWNQNEHFFKWCKNSECNVNSPQQMNHSNQKFLSHKIFQDLIHAPVVHLLHPSGCYVAIDQSPKMLMSLQIDSMLCPCWA